jgi:hypothetical protein
VSSAEKQQDSRELKFDDEDSLEKEIELWRRERAEGRRMF